MHYLLSFVPPLLALFFGLYLTLVGWGVLFDGKFHSPALEKRRKLAQYGGPFLALFGLIYLLLICTAYNLI